MSQEEATPAATTEEEAQFPDVSTSLFWDDFRVSCKVVGYSLLCLLVVAVFSHYVLPPLLVGILSVVLALSAILGLKIGGTVPEETGANWFMLGTMGLAFVSVATAVGYYFTQMSALANVAVLTGTAAVILYGYVLMSVTSFLKTQLLSLLTLAGFVAVVVASLFFLLMYFSESLFNPNMRLLTEVSIALVGALLIYNGFRTAGTIRRGREGLPLEAPLFLPEEGEDIVEDEVPDDPRVVPPFGDTEKSGLKTEDASAAKAIVYLMTGVFSVGVFMYMIVAIFAGLY